MGIYDEALAELPKSKGLYDDVLAELNPPKEKGIVDKAVDFVKTRYMDSPDLKPYTPKAEVVLNEQDQSDLAFKRGENLGNVVEKKGKFGTPISNVISPAEKQVLQSDLTRTKDPVVKSVLQEQLGRPTNKTVTQPLSDRQSLYLANQPQALNTNGYLQAPAQKEANISNITSGIVDSLPQGLTATKQGIRSQYADLTGNQAMSDDAQLMAARNRNNIADSTPKFETATAQGLYSGATSLIQQIPSLAASIATGNPLPALASAGLTTEAEAYTRYKARGASPQEALTGALGEGAVEVLTELTPMKFLVDKFGKIGAGQFVAGLIARDVLPEQVATLAQDAIDTAIANPDKTWGDYLAERPDAAYQTLLATVVQAGVMGGASSGARKLFSGSTTPPAPLPQTSGQRIIAELKARQSTQNQAFANANNQSIAPVAPDAINQNDLLNQANQYTGNQSIDASALLEDDNVSNTESRAVGGVDSGNAGNGRDNPSGSAVTTDNGIDGLRPSDTGQTVSSNLPTGMADTGSGALDNPTPEPKVTIEAQATAFIAGNKPALLITDGEAIPANLPTDVKTATIPDRGTLLYRDDASLQQALNGNMGEALGYGINEKPAQPTGVVTARDVNGTVIQDVATDGSQSVIDAAKQVAGNGTVETRPIEAAMAERQAGVKSQSAITSENVTSPNAFPALDPVSPNVDNNQAVSLQSLPNELTINANDTPLIKGLKTLKAKKGYSPTNLLSTLKHLGGINAREYADIIGERTLSQAGYNRKAFNTTSKYTLEDHIEDGSLDEFLPPNLRSNNYYDRGSDFDVTEARNYLADILASGQRNVLPYEVTEEIKANKYAQEMELNAQDATDELAFELLEDEINEQLRIASNEERQGNADAREFIPESADSPTGSSQGTPSGNQGGIGRELQPATIPAPPVSSPPSNEREGVRPLVAAITKRRAAAQQIGKEKQFDNYLKIAKQFMAGETVKPLNFKLAAAAFKTDTPLADAFTALFGMAQAPDTSSDTKSIIAQYKADIANAKTVAELQAIARTIQNDKALSATQATALDDAVFAAQDALEVADTPSEEPAPSLELQGETKTKSKQQVSKNPFEQTSADYEKVAPLEDSKSVYVKVVSKKIEVVRNPSASKMREMKNDAVSQYGAPSNGDPSLRSTQDANGNKYYWKAYESIHAWIEPQITKTFGVEVNQNLFDGKPSHRQVVRKALYDGEIVPENVLSEYPTLVDDVAGIKDNQLNKKYTKSKDNFNLAGQTNEEIAAAEAAKREAEAKEQAEIAKEKADKETKALAEQQRKNAGERDFVFGEAKKDTVKAVKSGVDDMFAAPEQDEVTKAKEAQPEQNKEIKPEAISKPKTPLDGYDSAMDEYENGIANADDYKKAFNALLANEQNIKAYLEANFTKQQLFDRGGRNLEARYKSEKKIRVVDALYSDMVSSFLLPNENGMTSYSSGYGEERHKGIKSQVAEITQSSLDKAMDRQKQVVKKNEEAQVERLKGIDDPQSLEDYTNLLRSKMSDGMSLKDARLSLSIEQREIYDALYADRTIADRSERKEVLSNDIRTAGQTVDGAIIETKHTKKLTDLFVVQLAERVSKEDYSTLNAGAKNLGGYYSSFRGAGAVPGFQFTSRENAEAFLLLAGGDNSAAKEQSKDRRDAFEDDKSQSAVERLTEMADRLENASDEDLGRERKTNTNRRAGMAARAEAQASASKAMAITMRNIAQSIDNNKAKYLGKVRQKVQVELLQSITSTAQYEKLRKEYPAYNDYEKHKDEPVNKEAADYAEFPMYSAYRSDLATLGRSMGQADGLKILGNKLLSVADDVTDAYLKFAKENVNKVSSYTNSRGLPASFTSKSLAEESISRSGFRGKAIVLPFKRGENLIIDSPSQAKELGIWNGDDDKKITLSPDFGKELVEKIGKANRRTNKVNLPWQFESAYDKRAKLKRMGIETPAEMRAALREFIGLKEEAKQPDKIKQMERAMIGRKNDGLDFFPTPATTSDEMIDVADIKEGMSVLEPSAGMGHIAERIRDSGFEPDVMEFNGDRRELLEAKGFNVVGSDFLELTEKYDRIIMNPPFSNRRDEEHVRHAYTLLKPNGKLVAIMGEGVFFGSDKRATEFRDWLESVGGTSEKLDEGTFKDASLPVNTSANARMVVIETKETDAGIALFSRSTNTKEAYEKRIDELFSGNKPNFDGRVKVLDRADMLDMLGMGNKPIYLVENKVILGQKNHPNMTAELWKKIPQWIDSPAIVLDAKKNRLMFIPKEMVNGNPIRIIVEPDGTNNGLKVNLLINAYDAKGYFPLKESINAGDLVYYDKWESPKLLVRSGLQLSSLTQARRAKNERIYNKSDLVKYRADNVSLLSNKSAKGTLTVADVKAAIANDIYGHEVDVYQSMADAPMYVQVQAKSEGATGIEGFFDGKTNRVALIANNLPDVKRAMEVARHELIGHYGVENMLNAVDKALLPKLLNRVLFAEKSGNKAIMELAAYVLQTQKGLRIKASDTPAQVESKNRRRAKEIIAVMAERNTQNSITKRVIDAIRTFLKQIGFIKGDITDAKIAQLLRDAQVYLKAQGRSVVEPSDSSFSNKAQTDTPAFKKWFGDSKVVNADGTPLVVYHGTTNADKIFESGFKKGWVHLTDSKQVADSYQNWKRGESSDTIELYVKATNPAYFDAEGKKYTEIGHKVFRATWDAEKAGYDAMIIKNIRDNYDSSIKTKPHTTIVAFNANQMKSATKNNGNFDSNNNDISFSNNATQNIPDAIILNSLGTAKNDADYEAAKAGDVEAATRLAKKLVTNEVIKKLKEQIKNADLVAGVTSVEQSGNNALPEAAAILIAEKLGLKYDENLLQLVSPKRTGMSGMDRIFNRPVFDGEVEEGASYVLVDDTITQGGTFAAMASHIQAGGASVIANIALTGKDYSSKITLSEKMLEAVRSQFGDLENEFRSLTKYGFEGLTHSEARFITLGNAPDKFRDRIIAETKKAAGNTDSQSTETGQDVSFSRASTANTAPPTGGVFTAQLPLSPNFEIPAETKAQAIQRIGQDKFNRFKVLQDWLIEKGVQLSEAANVYLAETLMSGRIATRKEDFRESQVEPLINKTQAAGLDMEQIGDFLKVQHAPEANKRARELQGRADATAYGVSDADAQAVMAEFKALPNFAQLKAIANEWRNITNQTKKIKLDSGLLTDEMVKAWEDTYDVYVPVKGGDDAKLQNGTGQGLNVKVRNKQRLGHELRDEAIIENILRDHESAISLDEKNIVGKALIKFAMEANNDDIITIDKPVKRKVLKQGETAFVVANKGLDIATLDTKREAELYIQAQVAFGQTKSNFSIDQTTDPVRVMLQASPQLAENEVTVYVSGHAIRLQINDDVAAREYKNMGVEHLNTILSAGREINNWLSKAYTGYSPDFIFTNPIRDAIQGAITLTGNLGGGMAAKIYANYPTAVKELVKHFRNKGTSKLVTEYRMAGGSTGGAYLSDLERIGNDIQSTYNEYQGVMRTYKSTYEKAIAEGRSKESALLRASLQSGAAGFKKIPVIGHFMKLMESINAITENALRVATYKTLSENGMSKAQAAAQAKNLMNFNRKGEQSNAAGALYLFFNPAVQGTKLIQEALTTSPHKRQAQALAGSMTLAAFTLAMMAMSGDDEDKDKWNKTPDYIKDGNIVFDMFGTQFTLTLPYGYRVFWTLGNVMADASQGKDTGKLGNRMASSLFQNFSPIGSPLKENGSKLDLNTFQIFPTTFKMLGAPTKGEQGEDGFGRPITPKKWNNATPDSQLMNRGTHGSLYDGVAEKLNELSGGSKYKAGMADVSPETLKFWVKSLTGGAGQFAFDSINIAKQASQGVAPQDVKDIPIVRKFVRESGVSDARSAFWERKNEADLAADEIGLARKAHDNKALMELRQRNGVLASMSKKSDAVLKMANAKRNAIAKIKMDKDLTLAERMRLIKALELKEQQFYDKYISMYESKVK